LDNVDVIKPKTIQDYSRTLKSFLIWFSKRGYFDDEILLTLEKFYSDVQTNRQLPWSDAELNQIFNCEMYIKGTHKKPSHYWAPLIALFTGARQNEICQLHIDDVKQSKDGVWYIDINSEGIKKLKNKSSARVLPIPPMLISLGFVNYVQYVKRTNSPYIFPELKPKDDNSTFAKEFSKWCSRTFFKHCGFDKAKEENKANLRVKTFHSFRKNFSDALYSSDIHVEKVSQLLGHTPKTMAEKSYLSPMEEKNRLKIIKKVSYDVDFKLIKN